MIVNAHLGIGYPSADRDEDLEFDDDASDEEIEAAVQEWAQDRIDISWERVEDEDQC
jgi:hypothetical protein